MTKRESRKNGLVHKFGANLAYGRFREVATELYEMRIAPPKVKAGPGQQIGEILRFARGLRLSAQIIYILREQLSGSNLEVNWGHLLDDNLAQCSPECDIIIHEKGHIKRWNGGDHPIMDFRFIQAKKAQAIVSCKSYLARVDKHYPTSLKKYGVKKVFLFAECCQSNHFKRLEESAKKAGYLALGCLYFASVKGKDFKTDESIHERFSKAIQKAVDLGK